jgi:hypothetical protein
VWKEWNMSILIKGMEMPRSCAECPVNMNICKRGYKYLLAHVELYDQRADDCHITTVPPHGRLIDADALMKELDIDDLDDRTGAALLMAVFLEVLKSAPTIIEAEEGET